MVRQPCISPVRWRDSVQIIKRWRQCADVQPQAKDADEAGEEEIKTRDRKEGFLRF